MCGSSNLANIGQTACAMMGFGSGVTFAGDGVPDGSGTIWKDQVNCSSSATYTDLSSCTSNGWGSTSCNHSGDIGLGCNASTSTTQQSAKPGVRVRHLNNSSLTNT